MPGTDRTLTIALPADLNLVTAALEGVTRRYPDAVLRNEGNRWVIEVALGAVRRADCRNCGHDVTVHDANGCTLSTCTCAEYDEDD